MHRNTPLFATGFSPTLSAVAAAMMLAAPVATIAAEPTAQTIEVDGPTRADEINAYLMQGLTRARLAELYPNLSDVELDKLVQRTERIVAMLRQR